ncbi:MAG: hypothetical protein WCG27_07500 [Pseudomonadota bacterium]
MKLFIACTFCVLFSSSLFAINQWPSRLGQGLGLNNVGAPNCNPTLEAKPAAAVGPDAESMEQAMRVAQLWTNPQTTDAADMSIVGRLISESDWSLPARFLYRFSFSSFEGTISAPLKVGEVGINGTTITRLAKSAALVLAEEGLAAEVSVVIRRDTKNPSAVSLANKMAKALAESGIKGTIKQINRLAAVANTAGLLKIKLTVEDGNITVEFDPSKATAQNPPDWMAALEQKYQGLFEALFAE